ncbi:MAG: stage III sporulation protein SpoIIIAB [Clostridia bacterium]|nr:stage III sporulation protein SpoIIIAB [Clostridia bacterium]
MIFKIISSLLIVTSTTMLGFAYSNKYRERLVQIRQLKSIIRDIENQIVFFTIPIPDVLKNISEGNNRVCTLFKYVYDVMLYDRETTPGEAFEKALDRDINGIFLNQDDKEILKNFAKLLGGSNIDGQINSIRMIEKQLDNQEVSAEQEKNKYERMYKSIGILSGLAIAIVLF